MDQWNGRWVAFDVGETLVDETRVWSTWADVVGVPRLTFLATLGAVIARGGAHTEVFDAVGSPHWREHRDELEAAYGGFHDHDLYPDVRPAMDVLLVGGYRLAIFGNQPANRTAELRALNLPAEVIAMSAEMRVAKPSPEFFARVLEMLGDPQPESVAMIGDRVDNDVLPAMAAGLRAVWIRRGPWGRIQSLPDGAHPALVVDSLAQLTERIDEAFATLPTSPASV
jgi:HAD superfamily hydrolase (TIGR01549 family)